MRKQSVRAIAVMKYYVLAATALALVVAHALGSQAANPAAASPAVQIQTATTHPMKYYVSLPGNWSPDRKWPVLVAPSAHYGDKGKTNALFAAERDARKANFIIVSPLVINADRVAAMTEYRGAVADAISAADAATDGRDEIARAKFDCEGIRAVLKDVQQRYRGEDTVYITGFSSSTHIAYLFLFTHPELLKGVMINSGGYAGRGVDEEHIPLLNSPQRARIGIKCILGENDPNYQWYLENWQKTKAELLRCGHPALRIETEVIRKGNSEKLNPGHNWFPTKILDFFSNIQRAYQE